MVIIDNRSYNYSEQFLNGIPIKDFEGDINDTALYHLRDYLMNRVLPHEGDLRKLVQ